MRRSVVWIVGITLAAIATQSLVDTKEEEIILSREALRRHRQQFHNAPPPVTLVKMEEPNRMESQRSLWPEDFEKKAAELCGTSASLSCGKRVLDWIEGQAMSEELSVHTKCDLRDDFLQCIDTEKSECLELASTKSVLPELPPKEMIKVERSKLWKVLWTAGGCVLAD